MNAKQLLPGTKKIQDRVKQEMLKAFLRNTQSFELSKGDLERFPSIATKITDGNASDRERAIRGINEANFEQIRADPVYCMATTADRKRILKRAMGESEYLQLLNSDERSNPMEGVSESFRVFIDKFGDYAFETMCITIFPQSSIFTPDMIKKLLDGDETVENQMTSYCRERFGTRTIIASSIRQFTSLEPDRLMYVLDLLSDTFPSQGIGSLTGQSKIALIGDSVEKGLFRDFLALMEIRRELRDMEQEARSLKEQEKQKKQMERHELLLGMANDDNLQQLFSLFSTILPYNIKPEKYPKYADMFDQVKNLHIARAIRAHWSQYGKLLKDKNQIKTFNILTHTEQSCRLQLVVTSNSCSFFQGELAEDELIERFGKKGITTISVSKEKVEVEYMHAKHTIFPASIEKKFWPIIKRLNDARIQMAAKLKSFYLAESKNTNSLDDIE